MLPFTPTLPWTERSSKEKSGVNKYMALKWAQYLTISSQFAASSLSSLCCIKMSHSFPKRQYSVTWNNKTMDPFAQEVGFSMSLTVHVFVGLPPPQMCLLCSPAAGTSGAPPPLA